MLSYQPEWVTFLYRVRWLFVRLLGMKQTGVPKQQRLQADDVSLNEGDQGGFFTIKTARDEQHWVAGATESHLTAYLGLVVEPLSTNRKRFHVITIVHYHNWTGPVYFNIIRPFHHLVVNQMVNAGVKDLATCVT